MKRCSAHDGFIVAEVIISLGMSAIVIAALMTIYFSAYKIFEYQLAFTDIQYAERAVMQMIIEDVMAAQNVEYLDDGRKLRLLLNEGYVSYYLQNQTVYRHGNAKMPVANNISSLSFQVDSSSGYTSIYMEAWQGENANRIICSASPRTISPGEVSANF